MSLLKKTLLWSEEDDTHLKMAGKVLESQLDDVLDVWYGYVGSNEHLVYYFNSNGKPDGDYLGKVVVLSDILWTKPYIKENHF